jgi:ElaB/YqjD/DUF883 family membrane-anchored ribosome-binding protein
MTSIKDKASEQYREARDKAEEALASGRAKADEAMKMARGKADEASKAVREKAENAAALARGKAEEVSKLAHEKSEQAKVAAAKAAQASRDAAHKAREKTSEQIDSNPLAAVLGGLAIGAIAAALVPLTRRENELVGKTGKKIRDTAAKAARTAKEAGAEQLDALGINSDAAKAQVKDLVTKIGEAVSSATSAAADSVRKK